MKTTMLIVMVAIMLTVAAFARLFFSNEAAATEKEKVPEAASEYSNWSEASKKAVDYMKKKYGEPNEKTASMMIWHNNGPWKRSVVYAKEFKHDFPMPHTDVLEQTIDYKVPVGKYSAMALYDGSVVCSRTFGEISARCDKEPMNFLALNLAHDIIRGEKDIEAARNFYAKTAWAFMKGDEQVYTQKFQFTVAMGNTTDEDLISPLIDKDELMKMKKEMKEKENSEKEMMGN
jgi:hypothetical protein